MNEQPLIGNGVLQEGWFHNHFQWCICNQTHPTNTCICLTKTFGRKKSFIYLEIYIEMWPNHNTEYIPTKSVRLVKSASEATTFSPAKRSEWLNFNIIYNDKMRAFGAHMKFAMRTDNSTIELQSPLVLNVWEKIPFLVYSSCPTPE